MSWSVSEWIATKNAIITRMCLCICKLNCNKWRNKKIKTNNNIKNHINMLSTIKQLILHLALSLMSTWNCACVWVLGFAHILSNWSLFLYLFYPITIAPINLFIQIKASFCILNWFVQFFFSLSSTHQIHNWTFGHFGCVLFFFFVD